MSKEKITSQNKENKPAFSTYSLVMMALFAAVLCVSAYISISIPLPGSPHITLVNFVILLIALLFPLQQSVMIILVWMLLGLIGLPVFIGGAAGIGYLAGPWGGYTVSYIFVAFLLPLVRGKQYRRIRYTLTAIAGALFIDFFGMFWLMAYNHLTLGAAFATGFIAFLPLDIVKCIVAAQIVPAFKSVMKAR